MGDAAARVLRTSLREQLAALRGEPAGSLPPALLDVTVQRVALPGGDVFLVRPADWEQLRDEEGGAARPVPYGARQWPSGGVLAAALAAAPPRTSSTRANVDVALRLLPRLPARGGEVRLADPRRAGARDVLAAARATFSVRTVEDGDVALHTLRRRG
jgi:hypothetical protein